MQYYSKGYSVPKRGVDKDENEDAFKYSSKGWLAIADGATESSYSKEWAWLLVRAFGRLSRIRNCPLEPERYRQILETLQKEWHGQVPWERLNWLYKDKAQKGAFTTFLGVRIHEGVWEAMGVGDSNLFIVDADGMLVKSCPARSSKEFGISPFLVPSIPGKCVDKALEVMWYETGVLKPDEWMLLTTDAVAAYLLKTHEDNLPQFSDLKAIQTSSAFADWVEASRSAGMRNDDSTMVLFHEKDKKQVNYGLATT